MESSTLVIQWEKIWRFPTLGVLPVIIHLRLGINHPAIGVPPFIETIWKSHLVILLRMEIGMRSIFNSLWHSAGPSG